MKRRIEPTLEDVATYLKERPRMILSERNPYQADRLMMMLDNEKLAALEEEFNEHPNGIELPNFIWLMKCAISHPPEEKYELVNGLIKLFQDIDINGDNQMEWAEFTQYIIDAVIGEKDARFFDARFEMAREMTETEVLDRAYSRKSKRYVPMSVFDNSTHSNIIKKVEYASNNDSVVCLEQNSNRLKFYTSECQEKNFRIQPSSEDQSIFIIDFHVAEPLNIIAAVTSDRSFFFWENNMTSRIIKTFKQDVLQTGIWYMQLHKMWLTAGADYNIRGWEINFSDKDQPGQEMFCLHAHLKQITELVELYSPRLVASSSLDGKIKLWEIADRSLMTELKSPNSNNRGIRGLTYNYEYGSNLLSYGFDMHINVWCPEVSITRAFIGKLEGHSSLIVMCKFIIGSPNCISVDDRTNIRIWDIRTMSTVQVIASEQVSVVTGLCIISKSDKFVITGKRLNYYKNGASTTNTKQQRGQIDDVVPLSVEFNLYYNCFVVLTKMDIRLYDAMSGKLKKVFNELFDEKMQIDLSNFAFGGRGRKFFVSDNGGMIRQFNMKNGEFLKKVNSHNEIENSEFANKLDNTKKRDALEISSLLFLQEEKLLISASQDSTVRIYDESDPEESVLLKVICGGHQNSEILCMAYSQHFTLLATGSSNGMVAVWDFETGKMDGLLICQQAEVVGLDFTDPFPAVVVGQSNGVISVWTVRSTNSTQRYKCLIKLTNVTFDGSLTPTVVPVTSLAVYADYSMGIKRQQLLREYTPLDPRNIIYNDTQSKKKVQSLQIEEQEAILKDMEKHQLEVHLKKRRLYVYVTDAKGVMHILSLAELLHRKEVYETDRPKKGHSYQLKRKDLVDASKTVEGFLVQEERNQSALPTINLYSHALVVKQWEAHQAPITRINKLKEPVSFVTNSFDKHFKIWAYDGQMYASVNLTRFEDTTWRFPFDWVGQKLKDIELVFDALKLIEKEMLTPTEKDAVKVRFLISKFFNEQQQDELQKILLEKQAKDIGINETHNTQVKEKKRTQHNEKANLNYANKQVSEELRELKQRMQDDRENKKKLDLPTEIQQRLQEIRNEIYYVERPRTGQMVQNLVTQFAKISGHTDVASTAPGGERIKPVVQNSEEANKQKRIIKKIPNPTGSAPKKDREKLPQVKSTLQPHEIKATNADLLKNNAHINNMVNSLPRPMSEQHRPKFVSDMKYQPGEGTRALKMASYTNGLKFMSQSPQILCDDNEILRMKAKFFKELGQNPNAEIIEKKQSTASLRKNKKAFVV